MSMLRQRSWRELAFRAATIALFLLAWHVAAAVQASQFFPGPVAVASALAVIVTVPSNYGHILVTFSRVYESLAIAMVIGVILGVLPSYSRIGRYVVSTVIHPLFQSIPAISWVFLALVWFGLSWFSVRFILVVTMLSIVMINTFEGMKELDPNLVELGESFTDSRWRVFRSIQFPMLYPFLFSALRRAHGVAWRVVPVAELFVATDGVGKMMRLASSRYAVSEILAWTGIIAAAVIFFEYGVFKYVDEHTMRRWRTDG